MEMTTTTILFSRCAQTNKEIANRNSGNADDVVNDNNSTIDWLLLSRSCDHCGGYNVHRQRESDGTKPNDRGQKQRQHA